MRKALLITLVLLAVTVAYRTIEEKALPVGRDAPTHIGIGNGLLTAHQAFVNSTSPVRLRAYGPNPTIILEALGNGPVSLQVTISNCGLDLENGFSGQSFKVISQREGQAVIRFEARPKVKAFAVLGSPNDVVDFNFVIMGDNRGDDKTLSQALAKANSLNPGWIVNLGDFVDGGTKKEYAAYQRVLDAANLKAPFIMSPGNHDIKNNGAKYYRNYFGPGSYSFDHGRIHFIVLDTSMEQVSSSDYEWLERDLKSSIMPQAVVFTHVPLSDPRRFWRHHLRDRKQAKQLQRLFELNRVSVVIASHIHGYYDNTVNGVRYLITGGAGAPMEVTGGKNHIIAATIKGNKISFNRIVIGTGDSLPVRIWYMINNLLGMFLGNRYIIKILVALVALFAVMVMMEGKKN